MPSKNTPPPHDIQPSARPHKLKLPPILNNTPQGTKPLTFGLKKILYIPTVAAAITILYPRILYLPKLILCIIKH